MNRIFQRIFPWILIILSLTLFNCGSSDQLPSESKSKKRVALATINIIADMVSNVAGDRIEVFSLLPVGGDPHLYEPIPGDVQKIAQSDLVFYNGFNLEKWLEELLQNAGGNRPAFAVTKGLEPRRDKRGDPDPHLWMDVHNAVRYVENIRDFLIDFDPEGAELFRARAKEYLAELQELDKWVKEQVAAIPPMNRKLVTTHDAFRYFGERYSFKVVGTIWGITTEDEPSAQEVARLADSIKAEKVIAVFIETTVNPKLMEQVAREAGVKLGPKLYGDSLGLPGSGADNYIGMTKTNVLAMIEALK